MAKTTYSPGAQALPHRMSRLFSEIRWLVQAALLLFLVMALVSYSRRDPSWTHAVQFDHISNWAGRVGAWTADMLFLLFGLSAYWWVVLLARGVAGASMATRTMTANRRISARAGWSRSARSCWCCFRRWASSRCACGRSSSR